LTPTGVAPHRADGDAVPVLLWHAVDDLDDDDTFRVRPADFARHLDLVVESGRVPLTATRYAHLLRTGGTLPPRAVLLTFDDGYRGWPDHVVPALAARDLTATFFVTTGTLGGDRWMTPEQVRELAADGDRWEVGAHSVTHPHLDVLPPARAAEEIAGSRQRLEDLTGGPVRSFAYPHGSNSRRTRRLVAQAGYETAHAVKNALSHPRDDVLAVARWTVRSDTPDEQVRAVLAGTGAPRSWRRERLRTWGYRQVRRGAAARAARRAGTPSGAQAAVGS